jgi:outer membrane biosynthesis protein TonB
MNEHDNENAEPVELISVGLIGSWQIVERPAPVYPVLVQKAQLNGSTVVEVLIGKDGQVEQAVILSGHPLVYPAVITAAMQAKFYPTYIKGRPIKVSGILIYDLDAH